MLGAGAVAVARRFGIPGLLAAAVGGYALKRYNVKREARLSAKVPKVRSSAT
jgi:NhaP-type Na+/H+ or K+/H+ antiporter